VNRPIIDTSVILAILWAEVGSNQADSFLAQDPLLSAVNYAEIVAKAAMRGIPPTKIREWIKTLSFECVEVTETIAYQAGKYYSESRSHGLAMADCICIATGVLMNARIITADRIWKKAFPALDIVCIRHFQGMVESGRFFKD
jgi:PIN domain nuclease of toxin-antitoxin system